jgi:hypothetical protein
LGIKEVHRLPLADKRKLSKQLHSLAEEHAQREEVCAFNLIEACQVSMHLTCAPRPAFNPCSMPCNTWMRGLPCQ